MHPCELILRWTKSLKIASKIKREKFAHQLISKKLNEKKISLKLTEARFSSYDPIFHISLPRISLPPPATSLDAKAHAVFISLDAGLGPFECTILSSHPVLSASTIEAFISIVKDFSEANTLRSSEANSAQKGGRSIQTLRAMA